MMSQRIKNPFPPTKGTLPENQQITHIFSSMNLNLDLSVNE